MGNRTVHSDPHIHQVQGSVLSRQRGKIPLQHPPRSKRSPHLLVSAARITHGYARGPWPGSRCEDPHVVIAPAQTETSPVGSHQLAAPGRAGVGLYPIEAGRPSVDSSMPPLIDAVVSDSSQRATAARLICDPPWSVQSTSRTRLLTAHYQDAGLVLLPRRIVVS